MEWFEKIVVNSPAFTLFHRDVLLPRMLAMSRGSIEGPVLEIGCGRGATTEGLARHLPGATITAVDVDPAQVALARERLGARATVQVADATKLPFPDGSFGTVVEMNALHHIPPWHDALREVARVLRPDGQFLFNDYTRDFLFGALANPRTMPARFTAEELARGLEEAGFRSVRMQGAGGIHRGVAAR